MLAAYVIFYAWIVLFGGAERIHESWLGAFEFPGADKPGYIKAYASVGLFLILVIYITLLGGPLA